MKCRKWNNIVPDQQNQKYEESNQMRPNIHTVIIPRKQAEIKNKANLHIKIHYNTQPCLMVTFHYEPSLSCMVWRFFFWCQPLSDITSWLKWFHHFFILRPSLNFIRVACLSYKSLVKFIHYVLVLGLQSVCQLYHRTGNCCHHQFYNL